ncbi:PAS domain S-box protein [Nostoc parmelioides]|uniref:histidine kinase n=1 Tax=Nostoc parmelioides FACHB-3921 TaxID=2692909 RepID=A0ABR8BK35_9NOSO|nr:PAS domain S-box protein [Nostoc parmelioides FACHB-3921]
MRLSNLFRKRSANNEKLKISLQFILTVPFVLLIGGTTGLVSYVSWQNSQNSVNSLAYQLMNEMSDRIHLYLSNYLKTPHLINRLNVQASTLQHIDVTNPQSLERYFFAQVQEFASLRVHFINPQGGLIGAGNDERGVTISSTKDFKKGELYVYSVDSQRKRKKLLVHQHNYDGTQRPFYQQALSTGKPTWTSVYLYVPTSKGLGIAASYALYNQRQELLGVFTSDIDLVSISKFLQQLRVGTHGQVFIMERSGLIVASSTPEQPFLTGMGGTQNQRLQVIQSQQPLIRLAGEHLRSHFGNLTQIQTIQQLTFDIKGKKQFLLVIPYSDQLGLDWLIVTVIPASDFTAEIDANTRLTIIFTIGALAGAIALGLFLTQFIIRSMEQLGQTSLALYNELHLRKIAELELRRQKDLCESIYNESADALFLVDPQTLLIADCNRRAVELFEADSKSELLSIKVNTLQLQPFTSDELAQITAQIRHKGVWNAEIQYLTRKGNLFWGNLAAKEVAMVCDLPSVITNQVVHLVRVTDITERKRAEAALLQSEARFQKIAAASPAQIYILAYYPDINQMRYEYISSGVQEIQELEPHQVLANPLLTYQQVHPDDLALYNQLTTRSLKTLKPFAHEWRIITPSGKVKWVRANSRPERRPNGEIAWYGVVLDITDLKQAEAALRESEERFRHAFYDAPIGMALLGLEEQQWLQTNPMLREMLGYSESEFFNFQAFEIIHPEDIHRLENCITQVLSNQNPRVQVELRYLCNGGRIAWGLTSLSLVRDCQNQPLYYVLQIQDITEQQAIEQMKNEFISIVSHELRTPLTAIQGFLGLLNTSIYDNKSQKAKWMIQQALTNSDRLVRLVNDILDLERLSSGRVQLVKEVCNAADLMQRAVEAVQSIALASAITISLTPTTACVWASPDLIIQTLINLLSNAIKFSPCNSVIALSAQTQSNWVLFKVQDQGRGIPANKLETIFERFQQVDISDARAKGGTGLGLAICQSIIQQHDGSIWAESTLGEGSTFYFTLPISVKEL